jgi:hypothetical protein
LPATCSAVNDGVAPTFQFAVHALPSAVAVSSIIGDGSDFESRLGRYLRVRERAELDRRRILEGRPPQAPGSGPALWKGPCKVPPSGSVRVPRG